MTLSNLAIIPGLHANIFSVTQALQCFHVTSEFDALILNKDCTNICFHEKMVNHDSKGYLFTTNLYKGRKMPFFWSPIRKIWKGRLLYIWKGRNQIKKNKQQPKELETHKIHANKINANIAHPKEDKMCATENHLHYSVKAMLDFF